MNLLFDSFWRAVSYCLHPRVIGLSLLPLAIMLLLSVGLGYLYWGAAVAGLAGWLDASKVFSTVLGWFSFFGPGQLRDVLAPLFLVLMVTPLVVVLTLLLVALLTTPSVLRLVAARRFPGLERRGGGSLLRSALWSLGNTLVALVLLLLSLPLWLIPPLILILPPLIWGWLNYRVMSHDALEVHATDDERKAILREHRVPLLLIGVICGYLGAAPAVIWASFALFAVAFPVLLPLGLWIYTLVFAFSALWFSHYCLDALQIRRQREQTGSGRASRAIRSPRADPPELLSHEH